MPVLSKKDQENRLFPIFLQQAYVFLKTGTISTLRLFRIIHISSVFFLVQIFQTSIITIILLWTVYKVVVKIKQNIASE